MSKEIEDATKKVDMPEKSTEPENVHRHKFIEHFKKHGKKLGFFGVVLLVLHILFHVIEILILPTLLVWLGMKP